MTSSGPLDSTALTTLLDATGGDPAFLAEMIDAYLADSTALFGTIDAALAGGRPAELQRAAHSLKSNSATFGAMALAEICKGIEERCKSGRLDADLPGLVEAARAEYAQVRDVLETTRSEL
jgi:HPt (histidine-containing phosphotransfer) domain-containing protein